MEIKIPKKNYPQQVNIGDQYGDIWASWNIDLASNIGKIRTAPRVHANATQNGVATNTGPVAIIRDLPGTYWAVCDQKMLFTRDLSLTDFAADTLTGSPTTNLDERYSDAAVFNGNLIVSTKGGAISGLAKFTSVWQPGYLYGFSGSPTLAASTPHPLCVGFTNELLVGNGNVVLSISGTAETLNTQRLILPREYEVTWIRSSNTQYWFGARNKTGSQGKVFAWDGTSEAMTADYRAGSPNVLSGVIKDEIPYIINGNGQLMVFQGAGFAEIARLPVANDPQRALATTGIHQNGMAIIQGNIHVLTLGNAANNNIVYENQSAGIWEYIPQVGLYHKYGLSKYKPLESSDVYDYGSPIVNFVGALTPIEKTGSTFLTPFLAGARLNVRDTVEDTTTIGVINQISPISPNFSHFITPRLYGEHAEEMWQKAFLTFKPLNATGDYLRLAYRTSASISVSSPDIGSTGGFNFFTGVAATWSTSLVFLVNTIKFAEIAVGNEVEVLSGEGSGFSSHIATISNVGTTYTVTLENGVPSASGKFAFRVANWKKVDTVTDLTRAYKEFGVGKNSNWVQFKTSMYNHSSPNVEVEKLLVKSEPRMKIT